MVLFLVAQVSAASVTWCSRTADAADAAPFHAAVAAAFAEWQVVGACDGVTSVDAGDCATAGAVDASFLYGDPDDVLADGVIATESAGAFVFNDGVAWQTDEEVLAGCTDAYSVETLLRHDVGHAFGLAHSCDGDCSADAAAAVMAPSVPALCDVRGITVYDAAMLTAGTLPVAVTSGEGPHSGAVPLEVCVAAATPPDTVLTWDFGDGDTATGAEVCHTYATDVSANIVLHWNGGGACPSTGMLVTDATVLACAPPHTHTALDTSLFRVTVVGATARVVNLADDTVPACVDRLRWTALDASGRMVDSSTSWNPTLQLGGAGTYTIRAELSGLGGASEEEQEVTVDDSPHGHGCATVPGAGGGGWLLTLGLALGVARARRGDDHEGRWRRA